MVFPAVLDIVRKDRGRYTYALMRSDQPFRAGHKVWDVHVDPSEVARICDGVHQAVEDVNNDPDRPDIQIAPFVALGKELFDCMMPASQADSLRRQIMSLPMPLLISTNDPDVHWELMADGETSRFLCFQCDVGRTLRTSQAPSWAPSRLRDRWRCLLIANPEDNLPAAASEVINLQRRLEEAGVECDYLGGSDATDARLRSSLREEYDIIHYAGHAEPHALRLRDREFTAANIRSLVKGAPMVFLNGCVSARAVGGLADAFIAAGARVVVGSSFRAPDEGAREFAETFYRLALGGQPAGTAMREARRHVMGHADWGAAWACFVMYGDPCLRLELQIDAVAGALTRLGLSRDDFDAGAGRVIERAFTYGTRMGAIETAHLFAALVGGGNAFVRDRLRHHRVEPAVLETMFADAFTALEGVRARPPAGPAQPGCTPNARAILLAAKASARRTPGARISELDLLRAFVRSGGGRTADVLRRLGVPLEDLDPDAAGGASPPA